jgi:hypothetical protein
VESEGGSHGRGNDMGNAVARELRGLERCDRTAVIVNVYRYLWMMIPVGKYSGLSSFA